MLVCEKVGASFLPVKEEKHTEVTIIPYYEILESVERQMIEKAMKAANNNKSLASKILGLPRQTFRYRIEKLGMR